MWNATMGVDFDKSGQPYLSFYDNWYFAVKDDYITTKAAFGSPVEIYDRIPLTKELISEMAKIKSNKDSDDASDTLTTEKEEDTDMIQLEKEIERNPILKKEYSRVLNSIRSRYKKE